MINSTNFPTFCEEKNNCCAEQNKYHEYDNADLPQQFSIHTYSQLMIQVSGCVPETMPWLSQMILCFFSICRHLCMVHQVSLQCCTGSVISRQLSNERNTFFRDLMNDCFLVFCYRCIDQSVTPCQPMQILFHRFVTKHERV